MNDDSFNFDEEELKFIEDCDIVKDALKKLVDRDHSLVEATGLILGVIALHFKAHGYTQQDFAEFLDTIGSTGWPDDKKPKLKLVKK